MASTTVVVDLEDGAALSPDRLVARLISAVPEAKETALAAQAEKSWPRLVAAILAHTDAILAADDADGETCTRAPAPQPADPSSASSALRCEQTWAANSRQSGRSGRIALAAARPATRLSRRPGPRGCVKHALFGAS